MNAKIINKYWQIDPAAFKIIIIIKPMWVLLCEHTDGSILADLSV